MQTEPPDRLYLVPEVNAGVRETGGLLGLRKGERVMIIGVPFIDALTVDQLRGVIAHELGAGGDTRLSGLTYRVGASIGRTIRNVGDDSWLGRLFDAYGRMTSASLSGCAASRSSTPTPPPFVWPGGRTTCPPFGGRR